MSGLRAAIKLAIVPSPQPMSKIDAPLGICAASTSASTRARRPETSVRCQWPSQERVPEVGEKLMNVRPARPSFQVVVANVSAAAGPQHAEKNRAKHNLHTQKQPHRPEQHPAGLIQRTKIAGGPMPGNPRTACKSHKENRAANQQTHLERYALENPFQRDSTSIESFGVTEDLGKRSDGKDLRAEQREDDSEDHRMQVQRNPRRNLP